MKNIDVCDKNYVTVIKKYEDSKQKLYTCLVWTSKVISNEELDMLNGVRDLTVIQKTPMRVMHRRTLMDRKKTILKLEASRINENFLVYIIKDIYLSYSLSMSLLLLARI